MNTSNSLKLKESDLRAVLGTEDPLEFLLFIVFVVQLGIAIVLCTLFWPWRLCWSHTESAWSWSWCALWSVPPLVAAVIDTSDRHEARMKHPLTCSGSIRKAFALHLPVLLLTVGCAGLYVMALLQERGIPSNDTAAKTSTDILSLLLLSAIVLQLSAFWLSVQIRKSSQKKRFSSFSHLLDEHGLAFDMCEYGDNDISNPDSDI